MMVLPAEKAVSSARFARSARLLKPTAYAAVFETRRARRGRFFHLHYGPIAEIGAAAEVDTGPRLGIAVPKKLLKTAVHRNLVKRIARENFRQLMTTLDHRDYVLRLSVRLDPAKQPLDRKGLSADIQTLFAGRSPAEQRKQMATANNEAAEKAGQ